MASNFVTSELFSALHAMKSPDQRDFVANADLDERAVTFNWLNGPIYKSPLIKTDLRWRG